jgi:hypothetical protein
MPRPAEVALLMLTRTPHSMRLSVAAAAAAQVLALSEQLKNLDTDDQKDATK